MNRKTTYRLLAVLLALAVIEGSSWIVEALLPPPPEPVPTAAPGDQSGFVERLGRMQEELGHQFPLVKDEQDGWSLPPGTTIITHDGNPVRVNSLGFRGPEVEPRAQGELRLMTLGDSSVFGHGVWERDVLSSVAARAASERLDRPVSAVIGATPGHDSGQALRTLQDKGWDVAPHWVVIGTLWSDVYAPKPAAAVSGDDVPAIQRALRGLASYRLLRRALEPALRPRKVGFISSPDDIGSGDDVRVPLDEYEANLRALADHAYALGARPVFLILPAPMDFAGDELPPTVVAYRDAMRKVAAERHAPVLDGPEAYRDAGAGVAWFLDQVHPSPKGHEVLGLALGDLLVELATQEVPPPTSMPIGAPYRELPPLPGDDP